VTNSSNLQVYVARAEEARRAADAATLDTVRDSYRRSEAAWTQMAERAAATEERRINLALNKAETPQN
jgi:hypothetical protein